MLGHGQRIRSVSFNRFQRAIFDTSRSPPYLYWVVHQNGVEQEAPRHKGKVSMRIYSALFLAMASLTLLSSESAHSQVLFSNLPFDSANGAAIVAGSSATSGYNEQSIQFTPSVTANLGSVQVPFLRVTGANDAVTIGIYTSFANHPGTLLASQTIPANTISSFTTGSLFTVNFGGSPLLTAGTLYFVDATTTGTTFDGWVNNASNTFYPAAFRTNPTSAYTLTNGRMGLQVNGAATATPEPGSMALLAGLSISSGMLLKRRRR